MTYLTNSPAFGLAIDWETSGYTPPPGGYADKHQGLSFGAIVFDFKTFEPVESLYREIKYDSKYLWEAGAEKVHGLSRDYLAAKGCSQEEAALDLGNLVFKWLQTESVMLLGHRVHFDKCFTDQLTDVAGFRFNVHPAYIDTSVLGMVLMETPRSQIIFETMGMPARGVHNALEDIKYTIRSVGRMKELFLKGVEAELSQ